MNQSVIFTNHWIFSVSVSVSEYHFPLLKQFFERKNQQHKNMQRLGLVGKPLFQRLCHGSKFWKIPSLLTRGVCGSNHSIKFGESSYVLGLDAFLFVIVSVLGDKYVFIVTGLLGGGGVFSRSFTTYDPYVIALAEAGDLQSLKAALKLRGVNGTELESAASLLMAKYGGI